VAVVFVLVGAATMYSFLSTPLQPLDPAANVETVVTR
jgi:predicted membrane-bound dolichyl-phosphate-mannose-protein mannosyltransferase